MPSAIRSAVLTNRLLARLPLDAVQRIAGLDKHVTLERGAVLCESGQLLRHVYFPLSGSISLMIAFDGGAALEVGTVGREGMFGIPVVLGARRSPQQAVVRLGGSAIRLGAPELLEELRRGGRLTARLGLYVHALMCRLEQAAGCAAFHSIDKRVARSMLAAQDRTGSPEVRITQAMLATLLGVTRGSVTLAAQALQVRGLIRYSRGLVTVLDRAGLLDAACSCYERDNRFLPGLETRQ
jgi:CRP-like cAMP-binding protein